MGSFSIIPCLPCSHFIHEQVTCFLTIVDGIVHLLTDELVILQKPMIRALRKEQRRKVERIHQRPLTFSVRKQVFRIVVNDIMPTDKLHTLQKMRQFVLGTAMIDSTIISQSPDIMDFVVIHTDLDVYESILTIHFSGIPFHSSNTVAKIQHFALSTKR